MEEENWKDVFGYEGLYQVSNLGRVKSLGNGKIRKEKILKPTNNGRGYLIVHLSKEGKMKNYRVHRLVASSFIPNDNLLKTDVNHKDENPANNRVENLEWCTKAYNNNYSLSKPVIQYTLAGKPIALFPSAKEAGRRLGFSNGHICDCCNGKQKNYKGFKWRYAC